MSIPANTTGKVQYTGDGHTRSFPLTFPIYKKTDGLYAISVSVADGLGENATVLTERTDYTVRESGSSFCDVVLNTAPAAGNVLSIIYDNELSQLYKPTDFTRLPAASLISAFDKLTAICIQLSEELARCAKVDVFSEIQPEELVQRINRIHSSADNIDALAAIKSQITQTSYYIHQVENVGNSIEEVKGLYAIAEQIDTLYAKLSIIRSVYNQLNKIETTADIAEDITTVSRAKDYIRTASNAINDIIEVAYYINQINAVAAIQEQIAFVVNHIMNNGGVFYHEYVQGADSVLILGEEGLRAEFLQEHDVVRVLSDGQGDSFIRGEYLAGDDIVHVISGTGQQDYAGFLFEEV